MKLTVTPSGTALGARIDNIDISQPLSNEEYAFVEKAFHDNLVVCISGKPYDDLALTRFGERFGELEISVAKSFHHNEFPHVTVLSNLTVDGKPLGSNDSGQMWHTDMSYNRIAGRATILHSHLVPTRNGLPLGDTAFRNMYLAWETMPEALQKRVDGRLATYRNGGRLGLNQGIQNDKDRSGDVVHPVIRVHPETGKKSVYANPYHVVRILGMPRSESDALLDELFEWCEREEFQWQQEWKVADTIMWENRAAWHSGNLDYPLNELRKFYRTTVRGTPTVDRAQAEKLMVAA